jgi:hypothetical protein
MRSFAAKTVVESCLERMSPALNLTFSTKRRSIYAFLFFPVTRPPHPIANIFKNEGGQAMNPTSNIERRTRSLRKPADLQAGPTNITVFRRGLQGSTCTR